MERFAAAGARLVCPACRGPLRETVDAIACSGCGRSFPVVDGIADLRLRPDRFLSQQEDRAKGLAAIEQARGRGFLAALEAYWRMTPELDPTLAAGHIRRQQAELAVGEALLGELGATPSIDLGCGSGGLLAAVAAQGRTIIGVDAAFRWLLIGRERLRELGAKPLLLCANAEALPFADASVPAVCANDLLEHVVEPSAVLRELARTLAPAGTAYLGCNNRYSVLPEPHVRLPAVGWLPRAWQSRYVRAFRRHDYDKVRLLSAGELRAKAEQAGLRADSVGPAPLLTPHLSGASRRLAELSNRLPWPTALAPRFAVRVSSRVRRSGPVG